MKILVLGGTGFTGKRALPHLVGKGEVTVFVRPTSATEAVRNAGFATAVGDLDDPESLRRAMQGQDALICIASMGRGHIPGVVAGAESARIRRAVFVSTTAIFTRLAAASKAPRLAAERAVTESSLDATILRPTMIYGDADDRNMARLLRFLKKTPVVAVPGDGLALQQPVFVDDLAEAIVRALFVDAARNRQYDLSGAAPLSFNEIIIAACMAIGVARPLWHLPIGPVRVLVKLQEALLANPRIKDEQILRLLEDKAFDHAAAVADFGFKTRPFGEGIAEQARRMGLAP